MSGSCPVSARVCQETAAERERLRRWKDEALPVLDGLQELGQALGIPLGSRITGQEALAAVERLTRERDEARDEVERLRAIESGIEAVHVKHEIAERLAGIRERSEAKRLRAAIEALHHPEPFHDDPSATFCAHCQRTAGVWPCPTAALLDPTGGETDERNDA